MPSCTARLTSLAQTSFWKSTKAFARRSAAMGEAALITFCIWVELMPLAPPPPLVGAGRGGGSRGPSRLSNAPPASPAERRGRPPWSSSTRGEEKRPSARSGAAKPRGRAAARPAASPSASTAARSKAALQAPADRSRCADAPGLNSCSASSKASLPRDCEKRCTDGVHPPDIRSASQATVRSLPICLTRTAFTRRRPSTPRISAPAATSIPAARAASGRGPLTSGRRSAISSTWTPALLRSSAAR